MANKMCNKYIPEWHFLSGGLTVKLEQKALSSIRGLDTVLRSTLDRCCVPCKKTANRAAEAEKMPQQTRKSEATNNTEFPFFTDSPPFSRFQHVDSDSLRPQKEKSRFWHKLRNEMKSLVETRQNPID
jgi:hypothetical protein